MSTTATTAAPVTAADAATTASPASNPAAASTATPAGNPAAAPKPTAEAPKAPTQAEIRKLKLKLDGQDIELPEEEILKLAQMSGSAQKRWQEAAAEKKRTVEVLEFLKANPKEALKRLGIDVRKFSEETLTEIIKQEQESPEAKKVREYEEKLREYEARDNETKAEQEARQIEAERAKIIAAKQEETNKWVRQYDQLFTAALAKADVPKTPRSVARMAQLQKLNGAKGYNLDADSLAKIVSEDYQKELQDQVGGFKTAEGKLDGDKIMSYFGDAIIEAVTKAKISKLRGAKQQKFSTPNEAQTAAASDAPKPQGRGAWREFTKRSRGARY
jgi:hypothetical protein